MRFKATMNGIRSQVLSQKRLNIKLFAKMVTNVLFLHDIQHIESLYIFYNKDLSHSIYIIHRCSNFYKS